MGKFKDRLVAGCRETAANLSALLENDLARRPRRRVAAHLRRCEPCRSLLDSLAWTIEQLRALGSPDVAETSLAEDVVARIRNDSASAAAPEESRG